MTGEMVNFIIVRNPIGEAHVTYASVYHPMVPNLIKDVLIARGISPDQIELHRIMLDDNLRDTLDGAYQLLGEGERRKLKLQQELDAVARGVDDVIERASAYPVPDDLPQDIVEAAFRQHRLLQRLESAARESDVELLYLPQLQKALSDAVGLPQPKSQPAWSQAEYKGVLEVARGLIDDGSNAEYTRGVIELIADQFGKPGVFLADRKLEVAHDLGLPSTSAE